MKNCVTDAIGYLLTAYDLTLLTSRRNPAGTIACKERQVREAGYSQDAWQEVPYMASAALREL